ncbi:MAG: hypothetical protein FGM27_01905 [Candidatus Omnitrophica bacterium]|nr:hypothetical protein [Candidatus Omnitrophota bacterium]
MNDTHETPENDDYEEETVLDGSLAAQLQKIQEHLGFLEKKIDTLIEQSQRQPMDRPPFREPRQGGFRPRGEFGGFRSGGPRRDDRGNRQGRPEGRGEFRGPGSFRHGGSRHEGGRHEGGRPEGGRGGEARPFFKKGKRR